MYFKLSNYLKKRALARFFVCGYATAFSAFKVSAQKGLF
jgi:hypothetical protein